MTADREGTLDRLDVAPIPFKAALNMVPIIGGSLASLINDCMARFQQEAMKKAAEFLRQKVAELEHRIDAEAVHEDDFAELFDEQCRGVVLPVCLSIDRINDLLTDLPANRMGDQSAG